MAVSESVAASQQPASLNKHMPLLAHQLKDVSRHSASDSDDSSSMTSPSISTSSSSFFQSASATIDHLLNMFDTEDTKSTTKPAATKRATNAIQLESVQGFASSENISEMIDTAFYSIESQSEAVSAENYMARLTHILSMPRIARLLIDVSRMDVFSTEFTEKLSGDIQRLRALKKLKFWYNFSASQFLLHFKDLCPREQKTAALYEALCEMCELCLADNAGEKLVDTLAAQGVTLYERNRVELEKVEPHALYPTNIYRESQGMVVSSADALQIEAVMHLSITTSIKIERNILDAKNTTLRNVYRPFGRCVCIIDAHVATIYGERLSAYFAANRIELSILSFSGMESDKHIGAVQNILGKLKEHGIKRSEPVLIIGGGVITDIAGFATALYHRSTPYVMLCTSIVSGIDAGPSPRTCCDGFAYKNIFGAYHPPVLTLTDCTFFKSLRTGWIRHGIAEIIKMAVVKDATLFNLLERCGKRLISTKFGTVSAESSELSPTFLRNCDLIIGNAMRSYVSCEYGNLWETHQCRPHAYGHTWSPGFELPAGLLHGHAVACGMGFGAFLSYQRGWIAKAQLERVLRLISAFELSLWNSIMDDVDTIWAGQVKMTQKRGGNLVAPVPRNHIGECGYINVLSKQQLRDALTQYKAICTRFDRKGLGVEPLCSDVGLADPSHSKHTQCHSKHCKH